MTDLESHQLYGDQRARPRRWQRLPQPHRRALLFVGGVVLTMTIAIVLLSPDEHLQRIAAVALGGALAYPGAHKMASTVRNDSRARTGRLLGGNLSDHRDALVVGTIALAGALGYAAAVVSSDATREGLLWLAGAALAAGFGVGIPKLLARAGRAERERLARAVPVRAQVTGSEELARQQPELHPILRYEVRGEFISARAQRRPKDPVTPGDVVAARYDREHPGWVMVDESGLLTPPSPSAASRALTVIPAFVAVVAIVRAAQLLSGA